MNVQEQLRQRANNQTIELLDHYENDPLRLPMDTRDGLIEEAVNRCNGLLACLQKKQYMLVYECLEMYEQKGIFQGVRDGKRIQYSTDDESELPF